MVEKLTVKSLESPDETAEFVNAKIESTEIGDVTFLLATHETGWLWSRDNGSATELESCPNSHRVYMVSGKMTVEMDDGTTETLEKGDVAVIPPGHDAWTEGDEEAVFLDVRL